MAKKNLKGLALLGAIAGGAYLLNRSDNSEETKTALTALGFTGNEDPNDIAAVLKQLIITDKDIQKRLKGKDGDSIKGETGEKGDKGDKGDSGDLIQNYGGSLVKNGAGEFSNLGWTNGVTFSNESGITTITNNTNQYIANTNKFNIERNRLYRIRMFAKGSGSMYCFSYNFKIDNTIATPRINNWLGSYSFFDRALTTNFVELVGYMGGVGSNSMNFCNDAFSADFRFISSSSNVTIHSLIVEKVGLGDPVPHNLAFLPTGQLVFNSVDGKVGRYNGSTVDWFM